MKIKDEYQVEYTEKVRSIYFGILTILIDYFSLCEIGKILKDFRFDSLTSFCARPALSCLEVMLNSYKKDFCLTIWCICCDNSSNANTISKLKNTLNRCYLDEVNSIKKKTPDKDSGVFETLIYVRKNILLITILMWNLENYL